MGKYISPLQLAESLRLKKHFVWLDSLLPQVTSSPQEEGLSLLAAEPDLILEGGPHDWSLLNTEVKKRVQARSNSLQEEVLIPSHPRVGSKYILHKKQTSDTSHCKPATGAAIGYFRYDGSFCFGFYEKVYRHLATPTASCWLTSLPEIELQKSHSSQLEPLLFQSHLTAQEYCQKVLLAQKEIAAGNIYQVCLANRFQATFQGDPWPYYLKLRKKTPAPFAAYLQLNQETILSSSPECFLKIEGDKINTYPIKGTRPRGTSEIEDAQLKWELQHSPKEKAELLMITDLERNDLSQICECGSVTTPELLELKTYPHLYHLESRIQGKLRNSISHVEAVAACFPGGSISGVPKKKALEIIDRLEPVPRGLFTGAIGYFGFDGTSQFSIAIRTLVIHETLAEFHVGAGITSDSVPQEEWRETLHKAAGILEATSIRESISKN